MVQRNGAGEDTLTDLLKAQEKETQKIENELRSGSNAMIQASMYGFDDFDDY